MLCSNCLKETDKIARGLCNTCYNRWQRHGTVEYLRKGRVRICSVEGCESRAHGQGLCSKHLLRLRRTGTTDEGRVYTHKLKDPKNLLSTHDLYPIWAEFRRAKNPRPVVQEWRESFEVFTAAVGERPSRRHRIYPRDRSGTIGPDNWEWRLQLTEKREGESKQEYNLRAGKERREFMPVTYKDADLRRAFGPDFGAEEYLALAAAQNNCCAMCGDKETSINKKTGRVKLLSVDHNHTTGKVRALLCGACNTGLGLFRESPERLRKAIAYIILHEGPEERSLDTQLQPGTANNELDANQE